LRPSTIVETTKSSMPVPGAQLLINWRLSAFAVIDKPGFGEPGLDFLHRRGAGNAAAQQCGIILQLRR
jgi:hypothetical protein